MTVLSKKSGFNHSSFTIINTSSIWAWIITQSKSASLYCLKWLQLIRLHLDMVNQNQLKQINPKHIILYFDLWSYIKSFNIKIFTNNLLHMDLKRFLLHSNCFTYCSQIIKKLYQKHIWKDVVNLIVFFLKYILFYF